MNPVRVGHLLENGQSFSECRMDLSPVCVIEKAAFILRPLDVSRSPARQIGCVVGRLPVVRRLGEPSDVARAVMFLVSEQASLITAEVMDVNGGFLID